MPQGKFTIYDVPEHIRARNASEARKRLQGLLQNPHITLDQRKELMERVAWAAKWETLNIEDVLPKPEPTHHSVDLVENLSLKEQG